MKKIGVGYFESTPRAKELVNKVLDSGRISYGPMSKAFEDKFALAHRSRFAVLSNSGTSSLQVALQALKELHGWQDGDEVIIPAVTFVATANIVLHNRMVPVPVDVDPFTYNIDPVLIEPAITERTRAIIPVHLFGQMADMTRIMAIANRNGLRVIEDSCECMFATHNGKYPGEFGDVACFSTYVAHLITTGVGGIGVTNNPTIAAKMRSLVNHGRDGIYLSMDTRSTPDVISRRFNFDSVGHSFRITELEAALGVAQLETADEMIRKRQFNADYLTNALSDLYDVIITPTVGDGNTHSYMMYPIIYDGSDGKQYFCEYLEKDGIETREMLPLINQPVYPDWNSDQDKWPVARWINESGLYIGCHQGLELSDLDHISDSIHYFFESIP